MLLARAGRSATVVMLAVVAVALTLGAGACSEEEAPPKKAEEPKEDLNSLPYEPHFEPDVNNLQARAGVEPATKAEQEFAVVKLDTIEFPADKVPSVRDWQPGRIVASGQGGADNPLGYARKVLAVTESNGTLVVTTEHAGLRDLVAGELRVRLDDREGMEPDISKIEPDWIANNLYNRVPIFDPGLEPLKSDAPSSSGDTTPGSGLCCGLGAVVSAAGSVKASLDQAMGALGNVTVRGEYNGDGVSVGAAISTRALQAKGSFTKEIKVLDIDNDVFKDWSYEKEITKAHMTVFLKGNLNVKASATLNPGFQFRAFVPFEDSLKEETMVGVSVQARAESSIRAKGDLEVGIKSADISGSKYGSEAMREQISKGTEVAEKALTSLRKEVFGNPDVKPEGLVTTTLWISSPKSVTITAGPVPIVITSTLQLDLVCGFEAKATQTYDITLTQAATFSFDASVHPYAPSGKRIRLSTPEFDYRKNFSKEILGGGEISLSCGLVPRVNVLLYDTAGVNFGLRGSLKAKLSYQSKCQDKVTTPKADLTLGLYANYGVRVGGRLQAPGSSLLGTKGQNLGIDIGPTEPWNDEKELKKWTWEFDKGIGYCTPLCRNSQKNDNQTDSKGLETDVDCGGGSCDACAAGKECKVNTDCVGNLTSCNNGKCSQGSCSTGAKDGDESDIDCGGSCGACAVGKGCNTAKDCGSGFCNATTRKCVASSCEDGVRSGSECGVDCGGSCTRCAAGAHCADGAQCQSGFSNGILCVTSSCADGVKSGTEIDRDCGGANACNRCGVGMGCAADSDCQGGYFCTTGKCTVKVDPTPTCTDRLRNQDESDADCGGSKCAKCAAGFRCSTPLDCVSNACLGGKCGGQYTIGGTVSGLVGSVTLTSSGQSVAISNNGTFAFSSAIGEGAAYAVTIAQQPIGQTCTVQNGAGTLGAGNITNVQVTCQSGSFTVGGTVAGLTGTIVLRNNGGNDLAVNANGSFAFSTPISFQSAYAVTVATQPVGQSCTVQNASGTMGGLNVTNVAVTCGTNSYTVGGNVSGLTSGTLVLRNSGGDDLSLTANGMFVFTTPVPSQSAYAVTVFTNPAGHTCNVTNGSGTIGAVNVTTASVSCTRNSYTVGGAVSGLAGTVVLRQNGADDLAISSNGLFTFSQAVLSGSGYNVSVGSNPVGQVCSVTNPAGTIGAMNVSNVAVNCSSSSISIGGTVTGLPARAQVTLINNAAGGGETVIVTGSGSFSFAQIFTPPKSYVVAVSGQSPNVDCLVTSGSGTANTSVTSILVTCTQLFKYAFVTSQTWNGGAVGGLVGADAKCQAAAVAAGRPGDTYRAWLSSASVAASTRMTQPTIPYRRFDNITQIAASYAALTSGTLANAINLTENLTTMNIAVWSNTTPSGASVGGANCNNWTSTAGTGLNGDSSATSAAWTQAGGLTCTSLFALYCFEQ